MQGFSFGFEKISLATLSIPFLVGCELGAVDVPPASAAGEIRIQLEGQKNGCRMRVADEGIGIPGEELDQVFDKFYQSSGSRNQTGGTGLGLAICREIIDLHQGRIWAENNAGKGTSILFEIPRQLPQRD